MLLLTVNDFSFELGKMGASGGRVLSAKVIYTQLREEFASQGNSGAGAWQIFLDMIVSQAGGDNLIEITGEYPELPVTGEANRGRIASLS